MTTLIKDAHPQTWLEVYDLVNGEWSTHARGAAEGIARALCTLDAPMRGAELRRYLAPYAGTTPGSVQTSLDQLEGQGWIVTDEDSPIGYSVTLPIAPRAFGGAK